MRGYALLTSLTLVAALGVGWGSSTGSKNFPGKWRLFSPASTGCAAIDTSLFAYIYDAENIDGTSNSTISDGELIGTWSNEGSGADATQTVGAYKPVAELLSLNNRASVAFDGVADVMTIGSSTTGLSFIHETGTFDIYFVFRKDLSTTRYILANTNTTSHLGFLIYTTAADKVSFVGTRGVNGTNNISYTSTFTVSSGEWAFVEMRGDGTTFRAAKNGGTYETGSFGNKPFTAGSATNSATIASDGITTTSRLDGAFALILISSSELTTDQRTQVESVIGCRYGL